MKSQNVDLETKARKRVKAKKGFYIHLGTYLVCVIFFFLLNLLTGYREGFVDLWFMYPTLGWGVGVGIHYLSVFGFPGTDILTSDWEEREYVKELERLEDHRDEVKRLTSPRSELDLPEPAPKERRMAEDRWKEDDLV